MRFAPFPIAAALLVGCDGLTASAPVYAPQRPGSVDQAMCLLGFTAVPLRELVSGHHLVDVVLNGRRGTFVLDTGANLTVVDTPRAADFGLGAPTAVPAVAMGLGGGMRASQRRVGSLAVGGVAIRQSRIMAADLSAMTGILGKLSGAPIAGIVGQDVLTEHRAVIDVARPILYLIAADRDPAPVDPAGCVAPPA